MLSQVRTRYSKFRGPILLHFIGYAYATGIDGVTSNLFIFVVFNTKEFRIMAASIYI
jgi:hypothetical protein